jgi:tRNA(adenine34) deaminase
MEFINYMQIALDEAKFARSRGEVPIGAVIVSASGEIISRAGNRTRELSDPSAHAELLAIREACQRLNSQRIPDYDLYVTLEPCGMCAGVIAHARIRRLYIGAADPKSGGVLHGARIFEQPQSHHKPEVYDGISDRECELLIKSFFKGLR